MTGRAVIGTVINVTFPRSGQRLLKSILGKYFQNDFVYWESHDGRIKIGERIINPGTPQPDEPPTYPADLSPNYIKTHDFAFEGTNVLRDIIPTDRRYIVQYRHPLESIPSHYEYGLKVCGMMDSPEAWENFLRVEMGHWKQFIRTWVFADIQQRLVVAYRDLIDAPVDTAAKAIAFMTEDSPVDRDRLERCVAEHNSQGILELRDHPDSTKTKQRVAAFTFDTLDRAAQVETAMVLPVWLASHGLSSR